MIGLMDCNNFFVSCERLFRPDLLKKPVAVLSSNDGCIVARSQEVKDLNIPMGVPYFQVKEVLTKADATLFSSNFTLYRDISSRVMSILEREVGICEIYSIDEAFFEIDERDATLEAERIRTCIKNEIGIPVSIGVASTKTLAKGANAIAKKNEGVCVLTKENWDKHIPTMPCSSVWGIGRESTSELKRMGIVSVGDFLRLDKQLLRKKFGVMGERLTLELSGVSVHAFGEHSLDIQQSIMSTRSFEHTTQSLADLQSAVGYHVEEVAEKLREKGLCAGRMSIHILPSRHGDFFMQTGRSEATFPEATSHTQTLLKVALDELSKMYKSNTPYKKAGVVVSALVPEDTRTVSLFRDGKNEGGSENLDSLLDSLNERFGAHTLHSAIVGKNGSRTSAKLRSKEYTTKWKDIPIVVAK